MIFQDNIWALEMLLPDWPLSIFSVDRTRRNVCTLYKIEYLMNSCKIYNSNLRHRVGVS